MTPRLGFLIIAHSEPGHVARLARKLEPVADGIWVHVNAKSDLGPFQSALPSACTLVRERVPVTWGSVSLWDAVRASAREALATGSCDRLVLLSQSCYPLVDAPALTAFFQQEPDAEYIGAKSMYLQAIGRWRLKADFRRSDLPSWMARGLAGSLVRRLSITRPTLDWKKALRGLSPYSGCMWWSLTAGACAHVIHQYETRPGLMDYAQGVFGPEEIIPHTLLKNSPFAPNIRHHLTYEDWSRRGPSPKWLGEADVRKIRAGDFRWKDRFGAGHALFARKFGGDEGRKACDWLDGGLGIANSE